MHNEEAQRRDELARTLQELFPEAELKLVWIRDSLLLRGTVASEEEVSQISEIAEQYAPKVLDQLRVVPHQHNDSDESRKSEPPKTTEQSRSITLPSECVLAINPAGKVDLASCAECHATNAVNRLELQFPDDSLLSDIRALHDDVRKLIALLEQRIENHTPPGRSPQRQHRPTGRRHSTRG